MYYSAPLANLSRGKENIFNARRDQIELSFIIDGVRLFKSSGVHLWPILCSIKHFEPFVAVYCCNTKKL
jgi:hypothetical protein